MRRTLAPLAAALLTTGVCRMSDAQPSAAWPIHSLDRPRSAVVDPGPYAAPAPPPSDAVVLLDGRSLDAWRAEGDAGRPAGWRVRDGYVEVAAGAGGIATARPFGDVQLHIEWMAPAAATGEGQDRGNSGVIFMGRYELQVLDSYRNATYADGQAGAIYGQHPPLVNASRPPGEWQTYDVVFRRPRFDGEGRVVRPARMTVLHNGVLVQDAAVLSGPTGHRARPPYAAHADALPLVLQDHSHPVRYRNAWARPLPEEP